MSSDAHRPADPDFAARIRTSFERQGLMAHLGAGLVEVAPGRVVIALPVRPEVGQQHGFVHGGALAAVLDSACGYAALSLTPPGHEVLTVEFKVNFLAPARGTRILAEGRVLRAGRRLIVVEGRARAEDGATTRDGAHMTATLLTGPAG
ncbi:MAG: PaaI family thioesterase [Alphaproteobacteria bacterium]|nr:MAG: PaaI family thioesterase [Alphaproteobacteria bacterium]